MPELWLEKLSGVLMGTQRQVCGGWGVSTYFSAELHFPFGLAACFL